MGAREDHIVDAAIRVFSRYGVKRSAMGDIADEAGISRQTLYNAFANKDEILRGAIRLSFERAVAVFDEGLVQAQDLPAQMDLLFQCFTISFYDLMASAPNSTDIVEGFNEAGQDELTAWNEVVKGKIAVVLRPHGVQIEASGLSVEGLADFIQQSMKAAKYNAQSRTHLLQLLGTLKALTLASTTGAPQSPAK